MVAVSAFHSASRSGHFFPGSRSTKPNSDCCRCACFRPEFAQEWRDPLDSCAPVTKQRTGPVGLRWLSQPNTVAQRVPFMHLHHPKIALYALPDTTSGTPPFSVDPILP